MNCIPQHKTELHNNKIKLKLKHYKNSQKSVLNYLLGREICVISIDKQKNIIISSSRKRSFLKFKEIIELAKKAISFDNSFSTKEIIVNNFEVILSGYISTEINCLTTLFNIIWETEESKYDRLLIQEAQEIILNTRIEVKKNRQLRETNACMIQNLYRTFSLRKKFNILFKRIAVAENRIKEPTEKSLKIIELTTSFLLKDSLIQLKNWDDTNVLLKKKLKTYYFSEKQKEKYSEIISTYDVNIKYISSLVIKSMCLDKKLSKEIILKAVYDSSGIMQALALFRINEIRGFIIREDGIKKTVLKTIPLYISYIISAPWNIRIEMNKDDKRKVEGAGTALVESAIYESFNKGTKGAVALESVLLARKFYEKLGFERLDWVAKESGLIPMILSEQKAKDFLSSTRSGRALPNLDYP